MEHHKNHEPTFDSANETRKPAIPRRPEPRKQDPRIKDLLLLALGEMIGKEFGADQILQKMVDVMRELLAADRGTIFLLDPEGEELVSVVAHLPELSEIRVPLTQGVAGWVARSRETVNIPYCDKDARFWKNIDRRTGYTTRSMLCGPLCDRDGNLVGVVQFLNKRGGIFTGRDEELLAGMSVQVADLLEETTLGRGPDFAPRAEPEAAEPPAGLGDQFNRIIGVGEAMRTVFRTVRKVAPTGASVLLRGESGTGKGILARALHYASPRQAGPFVQLDCTALPDGLVENELFGHERGAYTGADSRTKGRVEAAEGGTLFLDEIGDLPSRIQGKLLTLLQDRTYCRVGGSEILRADVRIVAATNRPLEELVRTGDFRQDLYYRLKVVELRLPPLRERGRDDLVRLINHFVAAASRRHDCQVTRIEPEALEMLLEYPWPGNVRELQNCLESAVIFCEGVITPSLLPLPLAVDGGPRPAPSVTRVMPDHPFEGDPTARELESRYIRYLLERFSGNRSACARVLGIGRNTLLRKLKEHGLEQ